MATRREARRWLVGAKRGDGDAARDEAMVTLRVAMETRREARRWRCGVRTDDGDAARSEAMATRRKTR